MELLFAVSLGATLIAAAIPLVSSDVDASRARAATRFLLARVAEARASAVARGATVALRFVESATAVSVRSYVDRDGDGVLTADGTDTPTGPALSLADVASPSAGNLQSHRGRPPNGPRMAGSRPPSGLNSDGCRPGESGRRRGRLDPSDSWSAHRV